MPDHFSLALLAILAMLALLTTIIVWWVRYNIKKQNEKNKESEKKERGFKSHLGANDSDMG